MPSSMLSDDTFSQANIAEFAGTAPVERTMTVRGTSLKAFFLLVVAMGFAVFGWNHASRVLETTSGIT